MFVTKKLLTIIFCFGLVRHESWPTFDYYFEAMLLSICICVKVINIPVLFLELNTFSNSFSFKFLIQNSKYVLLVFNTQIKKIFLSIKM